MRARTLHLPGGAACHFLGRSGARVHVASRCRILGIRGEGRRRTPAARRCFRKTACPTPRNLGLAVGRLPTRAPPTEVGPRLSLRPRRRIIVAVSDGSRLIDDVVPIHIEVLLPALVLGCMLARPQGADPHRDDARGGHQEGPEDPIEQRLSSLVSGVFMVLVGLSMTALASIMSGRGPGSGAIVGHVLAITLLANVGRNRHRQEAAAQPRRAWRRRTGGGLNQMRESTRRPSAPGKRDAEGAATRWRHAAIVSGTLVATGFVGFVDYAAGLDLRIYPLYLPAIAVAVWKAGARAGAVVAVASVGAWAVSHGLAGQEFSRSAWVINSLAHLAAFITIIALVSSLRRSHAEERRLARIDPLTGLANSRQFLELARDELERQRRFLRPLTIAYVDLDDFKSVNDRFGHKTGDEALSVVGRALREATRAIDHLARLGGDEFAVLMPETDAQGARMVLERTQAAVAKEMARHGWPVSCSIGAVVFLQAPRDPDELIGRADAVMYRVKQTTKNDIRIECFPSETKDLVEREAAARDSRGGA